MHPSASIIQEFQMRENPLGNALAFLVATDKFWFTVVFWLLILSSAAVAFLAWRSDPLQRSARHVGIAVVRFIVACMWWQQSLWKIPPHWDWGLIHWMEEMVAHASTELQSVLVRDLVLPNIAFFGPLVYAIEVAIAVSLMLGLLTRASAALGALMAINLWLGLYNAPGEWPWTYMFLVVIQLLFVINPPGRSLGIDALLWRRESASGKGMPLTAIVA
jgi:uncharacterized membrane protein YphA (DoxX/SURF4 family)